ncbi:FtsX-like permease family protein [Corynebacterium ulceribovis]|uniref:FtsX-like permease family protein n=1 Tax=Corynebacterium ulceribovis TaxID=487732 RepID=UPI00036B5486|nr:FtsX-like permease family protein [Corynebacterium ulceribovis]
MIAARLARRDITAHKWRTLVAIILFALPVIFTTVATSVLATGSVAARSVDSRYDVVWIDPIADPKLPDLAVLAKAYPGVTFHPELRTHEVATVGSESATLQAVALAANLPETPQSGDIVLARGTAKALGVTVEDSVTIDGKSYRIDGLASGNESVINLADYRPGDAQTLRTADYNDLNWLTDTRLGSPSPNSPVMHRPASSLVTDLLDNPNTATWQILRSLEDSFTLFAVLSYALLLATLIIALTFPVFAIAHKRQARAMELLSNTGARPQVLRATMLWQGALLGLLGGIVGIGLSWALFQWLSSIAFPHEVHIWLGGISLLAALGVAICGLVAAFIPTLGSSRARKPKFQFSLLLGPVLLLAGWYLLRFSASDVSVLGVPLLTVGVAFTAPLLFFLVASQARHFHLPLRLAARDSLRNWLRTSAAVTAVAVSCFVLAGVGWLTQLLTASQHVQPQAVWASTNADSSSSAGFDDTLNTLANKVNATGRSDVFAPTAWLTDSTLNGHWEDFANGNWADFGIYDAIIINDGSVLDRMTNIDPDAITEAKTLLDDGQAVVFSPNGAVTELELATGVYGPRNLDPKAEDYATGSDADTSVAERTWTIPAQVVTAEFDGIMLSKDTADKLGIPTTYRGSVLFTQSKPNLLDSVTFMKLESDSGMLIRGLGVSPFQVLVGPIVYGGGGLFIVFVAGLVLTLSSAESRRDRRTLEAVGAAPSMVRRVQIAQGLFVLLVGAVLGLGVGIAVLF